MRPAYFAGSWYPDQPAELTKQIDDLLDRSAPPEIPGRPIGLIAPHAGYRYSAPVAAAAYACLRGHGYKRVVALAFSHRRAGTYQGVDVPEDLTGYATPLGKVPVDGDVCRRLLSSRLFAVHPGVDREEHSLELQLPFLQRTLGDFTLVPLLVGRMADRDHANAAKAIADCLDEHTLLVASTDFTHFGPNYGYQPFTEDVPHRLRELADQAAAPLTACDYDGFAAHLDRTGDTICGRGPVSLLLRILSMQGGAEGVRTASDTSGQMTRDWTNSVTYQSFIFTRRPGTLSDANRAELLRIARQSATAFLNGEPTPKIDADQLPAGLRAGGACFVTLENRGALRGCIGNMIADGPLYRAAMRNAVSACEDPRFTGNPVTAAEVPELHIEISYLTPMKRVMNTDDIVVGRHGLLISLGRQRGVLLPQVAYERGWTREEFLESTCHKAGLPPDAWKLPQARIDAFEAEVFGEPK